MFLMRFNILHTLQTVCFLFIHKYHKFHEYTLLYCVFSLFWHISFPVFVAPILSFCLQPEEQCTLFLPPTLHCLWTLGEGERELCVCYLGGVAVSALSSEDAGNSAVTTLVISHQIYQPFRSLFRHETNTFVLLHECLHYRRTTCTLLSRNLCCDPRCCRVSI